MSVKRQEDRTFDDMLVEDLEPTEEEQQAIVRGSKQQQSDEDESPAQP